jgi:tellurite resistance protein TerC
VSDGFFREYKQARKLVIAILGGSILLIGILMLVLPGPAVIVIPAGLTVLATEFGWARRVLARVKKSFQTDPKENPKEKGKSS